MTLGIIINRRSRQNRKHPSPLPDLFASDDSVIIGQMDGIETLPGLMRMMAGAGADTLAVSGGDGTVQAILTELVEGTAFARDRPRLVLLPHGNTNMTAADLGFESTNPQDLRKLSRLDPRDDAGLVVKSRPTVCVENPAGGGPQHGMFFGSGGLYRAVVKTQKLIHPMGLEGTWATALAVAATLLRALALRNRKDPGRVYQATPMTIHADGAVFADGDQFLFLVTALEKLINGSRPFWPRSLGALRMTAIAFPVPNKVRSAYKIMYGGDDRDLDPAIFRSAGANRIALATSSPFTLDGEFFEMPHDAPLRVTRGPEFRYVCGLKEQLA